MSCDGPTKLFFHTDGENKTKPKKNPVKGKGKKKKKGDDEALEDSDDGDYEGLEVDYMSDESRYDPVFRTSDCFLLCRSFNVLSHVCFTAQRKSQKRENPSKERTFPKVGPTTTPLTVVLLFVSALKA